MFICLIIKKYFQSAVYFSKSNKLAFALVLTLFQWHVLHLQVLFPLSVPKMTLLLAYMELIVCCPNVYCSYVLLDEA